MRIGLIGEDPNDTSSIANLLRRHYGKKIQFEYLVKRVRGHQLDNPKVLRSLPIEFIDKKCDFLICIRDLDGFASENSKIKKCYAWYQSLNKVVGGKGILLLNIWELEALILADIDTFNRIFKSSSKFKGDSSKVKEPKEELMRLTKKGNRVYKESDCPEIFDQLSFDKLNENCSYFSDFISELGKKTKLR